MSRRKSPSKKSALGGSSFVRFLTETFCAKRHASDPKAARDVKILALESLERRELLFGSGGSAWIAISTTTVPEGAPVLVLMKWGDFGTMGGSITYTSGGMSPEVPRDHDFVQGSMNVGVSGLAAFVVTTAADDKGYPEDFSDAFYPHASGYAPGDGEPSANGAEYISEDSAQERVCTCACGCLNVEASVAPSLGAVLANTGTGGAANTLKYNGLLMPHPIVSVDDTLSSTVSSASDLEVYTVLTDLSGNTLWTGSPVYYNASNYTQGQRVHFSQQIDASGLADGTYEATTYVIEDYASSASIIRGYGQFVGIENRDNSPYGAGWGLNNVDHLVPQTTGISLCDGSGKVYWFNKEPYDASYDVPEDRTDIASLVQNGDSSYTLSFRDGHKETFASTGLLSAQVDRNNNVQGYAWNGDNTLHSVTDQAGRVTTFAYTNGLLSSATDFAGRVTSYQMTNGQLTQITMPDPGHGETQHVTTMGYDSGTGLLTTIADSGGTTTLSYNQSRQVTKITNPDSTYSSYNVPDSQAIVNTSGGVGTLSDPAPLSYTSSVVGTQTDQNGQTSQYTTNAFGETTTSVDAAGTLETLTQYNTAGLPTQITEHPLTGGLPDQVTKLFYDSNNNLNEQDYPDGTKAFWIYDQTWNEPTQYIDPAGREADYTLDPANRNVLTVTQVSKTQGLANLVTQYTYTPAPTAQGQTPGGLVATTVDPRGIETDDFYNSHGLLTQVVYAKGTSDQASVEYTYDQNDNPASFTNELNAVTLTTYDNLNHLVERQDPAPDPNQPNTRPTTTWQFDPRGDMVQMVDPRGLVTTYTYGLGSERRRPRPRYDDPARPGGRHQLHRHDVRP